MTSERLKILSVLQKMIYTMNQRILLMQLEAGIFQESTESVKVVCQ